MSKITSDLIWKTSIEKYFPQFIEFFAPDLFREIDFTQGYESLNKELAEIVPESDGQDRRCDDLIKVTLKGDQEQWVYCYCHLEVQGYEDEKFSERMFEYFYRIRDRFHKNIYPLAIYTHDRMDNQPTFYAETFLGMRLLYQYPTYSVLGQKGKETFLKNSDNPFSLVVLAGLYTLESKKDQQKRIHFKWELLTLLYEKNWPRQTILEFFKYLNALIRVKDTAENANMIRAFVHTMERKGTAMEKDWEWYTTFVEDARDEGMEKGIEEGILRTAKNMIQKGFSFENIVDATSLPMDLVKKIAQDRI